MALSIYYLIILILRHISRPGLKTLSHLTQKVYSKIKFFSNFNKNTRKLIIVENHYMARKKILKK